ncbi:MAG: ABC transporter ATP-binding protein [Kordiimonadaceae bacterium]|jgi:multiple sugar transport system ATP-binding protein|nr:ABC transporter ATP-binding protein [Kordiimonadaceae bacterium]
MPEIKLDTLSKSYDGVTDVLKAIDLVINDGEFTVLVGPSGCGKSTTLRLLAGLEQATGGRILVNGNDITDHAPKDRNMAMVFQNYALYPHMNVSDNIGFSLKVDNVDKAEIARRVGDVASMLGIEELLERRPKDLSGGQRQRVAIGRAIVKESEIFLFDEPLSNLDAALRGGMRVELSLLHQKLKKNMVYVTHDQVEAMTLGDRIIVMHDGIIQQAGTPEEIFTKPKNKFVAGFIGNPMMNFLSAKIVDGHAVGDGFKIALPSAAAEGQEIDLGIRPEHISFDAAGELKVKILVSEYVGHHKNVIAEIGGAKVNITVGVDQDTVVGEVYGVRVDMSKVHLFDAVSGVVV